MYSAEVRSYLTEKCPKDGTSNGWYMLDKDAVMNVMPELWKKAFARPRTKLPWLIVSNGKTGWEGPIPDRYEDAFSKVKDFIK
jgi:predicted alpha/beta superfamily hydrolase